jgi:hypothetical protein
VGRAEHGEHAEHGPGLDGWEHEGTMGGRGGRKRTGHPVVLVLAPYPRAARADPTAASTSIYPCRIIGRRAPETGTVRKNAVRLLDHREPQVHGHTAATGGSSLAE